jgi:hypothetical protein
MADPHALYVVTAVVVFGLVVWVGLVWTRAFPEPQPPAEKPTPSTPAGAEIPTSDTKSSS